MSQSNSWAEFAGTFVRTREAHAGHERAKAELKALMPEDAKEASGHGVRVRRAKGGATSFDVFEPEAPVHRSSESIAALAAALAKAQSELSNREKSLIATIGPDRPGEGTRSFSFAGP